MPLYNTPAFKSDKSNNLRLTTLITLGALLILNCRITSASTIFKEEIPVTTQIETTNSSLEHASITPRLTHTPLPTVTTTPTIIYPVTPEIPKISEISYIPSSTNTPLPPTFTPGMNQLTSGYDYWQLVDVSITPKIQIWEYSISPRTYSTTIQGGYQFLRIGFLCSTGTSLTSLLTNGDKGITLINQIDGFSGIYFRDVQGAIYPVQFVSTCWLAGSVDPAISDFTLHFLNLTPLQIHKAD